MLEVARERAIADGVADPASRQRHGSLVDTLVEMEGDIRLLVMGKHDEHLGVHVGGRLETVVRTLHRPILIAAPGFKAPERVMLAYDGSSTSRKGVDRVAGSPLFRGLPCHVVMVAADSKANRGQHGIDLLVMGAYGHSVIRRFLVGSTTTAMIRNATVPVLLLC